MPWVSLFFGLRQCNHRRKRKTQNKAAGIFCHVLHYNSLCCKFDCSPESSDSSVLLKVWGFLALTLSELGPLIKIRSYSSVVQQQIETILCSLSSLCYQAQLWPRCKLVWKHLIWLSAAPTPSPYNLTVAPSHHRGSMRARFGSVRLRYESKEDTQMWSPEGMSKGACPTLLVQRVCCSRQLGHQVHQHQRCPETPQGMW